MSKTMKKVLLKYDNSIPAFLFLLSFSVRKQTMSGKANVLLIILLGLALSGWGTVVYQNNLQRRSEGRITQAVWEQIESLKQTEDSIKQGIEDKKKAQAFIMQLDYEKELVAYIRQEITDSENRQIQYYKKHEDSFAEMTQAYKQKEQEYLQKLSEDEVKLGEYNVLLQKNTDRLAEYYNKTLESNEKIAQLEKRIDSQNKRIADYEGQLQGMIKKLEEYKDKQKDIAE
ncbi:MAG: hypothetical protein PHR84_06115 [Candidatus Omnitrophica bacterium]|nr:hypothetical protein [Candidatus Omnitrophota bacterium]MDD5661463.1 hypothetical protein [Candidatus Omnitrophota bacterium]